MLEHSSTYSLIFFRILQGVCVGALSSISPLIIKEISPLEISGIIGNLNQFSLVISIFFGELLSYIFKKCSGDESGESFWFIIFGVTFLTQFVQIIVLLFAFPFETPKYLLLKDRRSECVELVEFLYKRECV